MAARTQYVAMVIDSLVADVECCCKEQGVSADLLWLMVRQKADHELYLIALENRI